MPRRDMDSDLWEKRWFRILPPQVKLFWYYLCTRCDAVGVWNGDWELAGFHLGEPISESVLDSCPELFKDRLMKMPSGKYWLPTFVDFQYPNIRTRRDSELKNNLIKLMQRHGVYEQWLSLPAKENGASVDVDTKHEEPVTIVINNKLALYIKDKLPRVSQMKIQPTEKDCEALLAEYDWKLLTDTLLAMENKASLLKDYLSVNLTVRNWMKRGGAVKQKVGWKDCQYCHDKFPASSQHFQHCSKRPEFNTISNKTKNLVSGVKMNPFCLQCKGTIENPVDRCNNVIHIIHEGIKK